MTVKLDVERTINHIIDWIKRYFTDNGSIDTKAVIGISGGKDSTIAAALLVRALGPERVVGVLMPNGEQSDIEDAKRVCELLEIQNYTINIRDAVNSVYEAINLGAMQDLNSCRQYYGVTTNTPARIRMTILYAVAAMVGGRVCNTGNRSEAYVGYTTKYGDLAGDFALLRELTVREVYQVGDALTELPYRLIHKAPADGMSGRTDEESLGFTYEDVDKYLLNNAYPDYEIWRKMEYRNKIAQHKLKTINLPCPKRFCTMEK